jgi:hypothetical protein
MPVAEIVTLAKAVVEVLNGRKWGQEFSASFYYAPQFALEEMETLHVSVTPLMAVASQTTRKTRECEYDLGIAIQQRVPSEEDQKIDDLLGLAQEIADFFAGLQTLTGTAAKIVGVKNDPLFVPEHLAEARLLTSAVILSLKVYR